MVKLRIPDNLCTSLYLVSQAVKKAGLSDQAVRPFLPYFEARYKSQKDLPVLMMV